ncbi:ABC transporter ATP-binding protein [Micromonospora sp. NPDC005413]|uniref:ABC transporter ATP-binding protein n=1 Tax=Micromonospora sp. NPDC005413 TaxID=3154563 RepID=UPI0033AC162B
MSTIRATFALIRFAPGWYALNAFLQILRSGFPLIPALVVREVFDRLSGTPGLSPGLWLLFALLVGAVLARVTALFASVAVDGRTSSMTNGLLVRNALDRIFRRPGAQTLPHTTGSTVNRVTTDSQAVADMLIANMVVIGSAVQAIVALAIMASIDLTMTVIVALPMFAAGALITFTSTQIKRYHAQSRTAAGEVSSLLRELFRAVQAIQLGNAVDRVTDRVRDVSETRRARSLRSRMFSQVFLGSVWSSTSGLGAGLVLLLAASRIDRGELTVGDVVLFISYLGWITEFTALFSQGLAAYKQASVSLERLDDIVEGDAGLSAVVAPAQILPGPETPRPRQPESELGRLDTLRVDGLGYRHPSSGRGVSGVDLELRRGELVVVTGSVGSGKTTLLRALLGLLPADEGTIRWNGRTVADPAAGFGPPRCAYTPQVPHLVTGTVEENIRAGADASDEELRQAIHRAVFDRDLAGMPDGLETRVGPRGTTLSGGQVQRVAAAQMMIRRPDLLVFDDISSALDVNTERELWRRIKADPEATCLAVSHRETALAMADRVIVLRDGAVVAQGSYDELRETVTELRHTTADDSVDGRTETDGHLDGEVVSR